MKQKHTGRNNASWYAKNSILITTLEEQLGALQMQQVQLSLSHHHLQLQASLVQGLCDTLLVMKQLLMHQGNPEQLKVLRAISELQEASPLQTTSADPPLSASAAAPVSSSKQDQSASADTTSTAYLQWLPSMLHPSFSIQTITSLSDPTAYVRGVLARAPVSGAQSMKVQHMALLYRETVLQSSVLLHQMPLQSRQQQQAAVAELQQLWDRFIHAYLSVFVCGQQCNMEQLNIINCSTLQEDAEGSAAALTRLPSLLPSLGLTPQQQEVMSAAYATCLRHQKPITEQRRQLQLQMTASSSMCSMPLDSITSSTCSPDSARALPQMFEHEHKRRVQLDEQDQAVRQLDRLLHKDAFLRAASAFCVVSCLSWEQLARLSVLSWPHVTRPLFVAKAIYELHAAQLQQSAQRIL